MDTKKNVVALYLSLALFLLSACIGFAKSEIQELHTNALKAYQSGDWSRVSKLAGKGFDLLDKRLSADWALDIDTRIHDVRFWENNLVLLTRGCGEDDKILRVNILDPSSGKEKKVFSYKNLRPAEWWSPIRSKGDITYILLEDRENPEFTLLVFPKHASDDLIEFKSECDGIDVLQCYKNKLLILVKDERPHISVLDPENGSIKDVTCDDEVDFDSFKLCETGNNLYMVSWNNLYKYSASELTFRFKAELNVEFESEDICINPYLLAFRGDMLHILDSSTENASTTSIQLPFDINDEDSEKPVFFNDGKSLAQIRADSIYIFTDFIDNNRMLRVFPSAGQKTLVKGEYLINYGEFGLQVFRGLQRQLYLTDVEYRCSVPVDNYLVYNSSKDNESEVLYYLKIPFKVIAYNLESKKELWSTDYYSLATEGRLYDYGDKYLWLESAEGSKYLIDAENGNPLNVNHLRWGMQPPRVNSDQSLYTLWANWEVQYFRVNKLEYDRCLYGDFVGMNAISSYKKGDIEHVKRNGIDALTSGNIVSVEVLEDLYKMFNELEMTSEANRAAGKALIYTGDRKWENRLRERGLVTYTKPYMNDSFNYYVTNENIISFSDWGNADYVFREREIPLYKISLDGRDVSSTPMPIHSAYHFDTEAGPVFFQYAFEKNTRRVSWTPTFITPDGELRNLKPIPDTYIADGFTPERRSRIHWWVPCYTAAGSDDYVLGDFLLWGMKKVEDEYPQYTVGLDITGKGASWADTTLYEPVKVGDRYFAHKEYATQVLEVFEGTQADSIGLKVGDYVLGMGGYWIHDNFAIIEMKSLFKPGELIKFYTLRDGDTLVYRIRNDRIGYRSYPCKELVEVDPRTGKHLGSLVLDVGFHYVNQNTEGSIIYQRQDTLMFVDPLKGTKRKVQIEELSDHYLGASKSRLKDFWAPLRNDRITLHGDNGKFIGIDLSNDVANDRRITWERVIKDLHDCPYSDDPRIVQMILKSGEILHLDQWTGRIVYREYLPFETIRNPVVRDGVLYASIQGRLIGWELEYYR